MLIYKRVERLSSSDDRILDLGAKGDSYLSNLDAEVVGIDLEFSKSIDSDGVDYLYGDGRQMPFEDRVFDFVVLNQVIEHVDGRKSLFQEVNRVLKKDGTAFFSFPNRFSPNKPHGLPRYWSALPKLFGLRLGKVMLNKEQYKYYRKGLFPLSPIGARLALHKRFSDVRYITMEESIESKEIYGDGFAPQLFVSLLPYISITTKVPPLGFIFELVWSYVSYECHK